MSDNVNIIVQDTINEIVVNSAVTVETIDINVQAAVDEVTIIANPNDYIININRIIGEQVQSDWNETDINAPDFIKNKPIIPAAQVNSDWNATSGVAEILNKPFIPTNTSDLINDGEDGINPFITLADVPPGGLTSVGLSMPVAFNVANSPLTSDGTIAVSAAGTSSQYIRGDGQLATLPTGAGGGSTVSYYLNGSINASVAGYKQLSNTATIGGGTDFTLTGNGLIAQFLTDAGNPNRNEIPGGAWNFEMYFQANSAGGNQKFYVELLKYNGTTFTSITSSISVPEEITGGTSIDLYLTSLAVPTTPLLVTDRLAIRVYIVDNAVGRTITLHTEDNTLCEIITTFSGGVTSLNGLTANTQYLAVGTTGTDFNISSLTDTHTFNLPTASTTNRGALSTTDWTTFNGKFNLPSLTSGSVLFSNGTTIAQDNSNFFWNDTNNRLGIGTLTPSGSLHVKGISTLGTDLALRVETSAAGMLLQVDNGGFTRVSGPTARLYVNVASGGFAARLVVAGNAHFSSSGTNNASAFVIDQSGTSSSARTYWCDSGGSIKNLIQANGTSYITSGNTLFNNTTDQGGIVQIKAPGALSTDIALRVRNSADTDDLMTVNTVNGLGTTNSVTFNATNNGSSYKIQGTINVLDHGDGCRINYTGSAQKLTLYTANGFLRLQVSGSLSLGTTNEVTSAMFNIDSTTKGFLPPRMTTTQKNAIATPASGLVVYDTTLGKLCVRGASTWETITSI